LGPPERCTIISAPCTAFFDPLALDQVTGHVFDAVGGLVAVPAEHPQLVAGLAQERGGEATERAGAAGEQDGYSTSAGFRGSTAMTRREKGM
jgi:hypothetical protein